SVDGNSIFLIDHQYDFIYNVFYEDFIPPQNNITHEKHTILSWHLRKSLLSALEIGFVKYEKVQKHLEYYVQNGIFNWIDIHSLAKVIPNMLKVQKASPPISSDPCYLYKTPTTWAGVFNNYSTLWEWPFDDSMMKTKMGCAKEWHNSTTYLEYVLPLLQILECTTIYVYTTRGQPRNGR
ncbi:hypothetical protein PFISCL1PPCAC_21176, partial [Pristionchus fissidentatus]